MKKFKYGLKYTCFLLLVFLLTACSTSGIQKEPISKSELLLNTNITITLYDSTDINILDECFEICRKYDKLLNRTDTESEISKLNEAQHLTVSDDTAELVSKGLYYGNLSNGAFDISIQPVSSLWNFSDKEKAPALPNPTLLESAVSKIDYQNVIISDNNEISFKEAGMGLDLGAIAKGYIADKIKEYLIESGVKSAIINLGGNVLCVGNKPNGDSFKIGIQDPFGERNDAFKVVSAKDISIVTSGVYERYITVDNKKYHHILDPKTGMPIENELVSVTIISDKSVDGDALSTSCFALGTKKGLELISSLNNVYAMFVMADGSITTSPGFENFIVE